MKKFLLVLMAIFTIALTGCEKNEDQAFKFGMDNLYGTWKGIAIQTDGEWVDITKWPNTHFSFSATFYQDGTYSGEGYFGNGSGTYKAKGDMIYTYVDGEEFYRYKVYSLSDGIAEMAMGVEGNNTTLRIRVKKQ